MVQKVFLKKLSLLFLIGLLAEHPRGSDGNWWKSRRKTFKVGKGSDEVQIQRGDTIVTNVILNRGFIRPGPYRWHYAVTSEILIHLLPRFSHLMTDVIPERVDVSKLKKIKIENRGQKNADATGMAGSLVGALMLEHGKKEQTIPFEFFRCNCHHYVEYLSLGKVQGSWKQPLYYPVNKRCAVYAPLTKEMAEDIYNNKGFTLMDGKDGSYHLSVDKWPKYIEDLYHGTNH